MCVKRPPPSAAHRRRGVTQPALVSRSACGAVRALSRAPSLAVLEEETPSPANILYLIYI